MAKKNPLEAAPTEVKISQKFAFSSANFDFRSSRFFRPIKCYACVEGNKRYQTFCKWFHKKKHNATVDFCQMTNEIPRNPGFSIRVAKTFSDD